MKYPLQLNSVVSPISTILICGVLILTLMDGGLVIGGLGVPRSSSLEGNLISFSIQNIKFGINNNKENERF